MKTNGEPEILGTIKLDNPGETPGELYWQAGKIWCRDPQTGEAWDADCAPCSRREALSVIVQAWGERRAVHKVWGLRLSTRQAERYYGLR
jgi:hypothetical protein